MSGQATISTTEVRINSMMGRFSEDVSTVTNSSIDHNELYERAQEEDSLVRNTKLGKLSLMGKLIMILIIVGMLTGGTVFVVEFFNRDIQCMEG